MNGGTSGEGDHASFGGREASLGGGASVAGARSNEGGAPGSGGHIETSGGLNAGGSNSVGGSSSDPGGTSSRGGTAATNGGVGADNGGATSDPSGGAGQTSGGNVSAGGSAGGGGASGIAQAFPGAQGFGKNASGGRNGKVYRVTNLNDSGPGSFRDAVSASNRIVVFTVGGYVQLKTAVSVKSDITIAGQSAPGEGIGFRGGEISFANSSNIICRFLRVRPGSETVSEEDDALSLYRARNVMIDHASFEFAPWNDIDGVSDDWQNHPVTDITIQDSLIADPTGQQFGAHTESVSSQWAWYRNIFANSHNRNPLAKVNTVYVNNLLYNDSAGYTTHTSTAFQHDIVNNYFVFGPASVGTDNTWYQLDKNQAIYYTGNLKDTNRNGTLDGAETTPYWYQGTGTVLTKPWSDQTTATTALDAPSAARVAISLAGTLPRDALDALIIGQIATLGQAPTGTAAGTAGPAGALYTTQAQTGLANDGYGSIDAGTSPTDSDSDGMPDFWESATGSDPNSDDAMLKASDGYARVEHYLNWLGALHAVSNAASAVDVDLSTYMTGFSAVAPSYAVTDGRNGDVSLKADGHTAHFQPTNGYHGLAAFQFRVTGSDRTTYTSEVTVLVTP